MFLPEALSQTKLTVSTSASAIRTHVGRENGFDWARDADRALEISAAGPLMIADYEDDNRWQLYLDAPANAVVWQQ